MGPPKTHRKNGKVLRPKIIWVILKAPKIKVKWVPRVHGG